MFRSKHLGEKNRRFNHDKKGPISQKKKITYKKLAFAAVLDE